MKAVNLVHPLSPPTRSEDKTVEIAESTEGPMQTVASVHSVDPFCEEA